MLVRVKIDSETARLEFQNYETKLIILAALTIINFRYTILFINI